MSNGTSKALGMLKTLFFSPEYILEQEQRKFEYPQVGDVFRSVSFGMTEQEYTKRVRKDPEIKLDDTHAFPIYSFKMFGVDFTFNEKYLDGRLYRFQLSSELYGGYTTPKAVELQKAVEGMFREKYGEPTHHSFSMRGVESTSTWDFNGKTIEVALATVFKHDIGVFITITSTAMEEEAAAKREAENKAQYANFSANF